MLASLKALLVIGAAYYVFWRYAHFTESQAVILALMAGMLISIGVAQGRTPSRFEPFYIMIEPQWYYILRDQGLVDDEKWVSLSGADDASKERPYSVLRDAITVTVLGPELYYSNNHKSFLSELDLRESIPELLTPEERENGFSFAPRFYAKLVLEKRTKRSSIRCIQFGLVTAASIERKVHSADDGANIPLATLPHAIFNGYNNGYFALDGKLKEAEIEQLLKEYGWERGSDFDDHWWQSVPYEIHHKYVRVSYYGV